MARKKVVVDGVETEVEEAVPEVAMGVTTVASLGLAPAAAPALTAEETEKEADKKAPVLNPVDNEDKQVLINPNFSGRIYIGSKWWDFAEGKNVNVPKYVKDHLFALKGLGPV